MRSCGAVQHSSSTFTLNTPMILIVYFACELRRNNGPHFIDNGSDGLLTE